MKTAPQSNEPAFDKESALRQNPGVDRKVVEVVERLESQLRNIGVNTKTSFTLQPALGGDLMSLQCRG